MNKKLSVFLVIFISWTLIFSQTVNADVTISSKYGMVDINGKFYIVNNNVWGASTAQTISVNKSTGAFKITKSNHSMATNGKPASYPSIIKGSHWGNTTVNSNLPAKVSSIGSANSSWNISTISTGAWDAAYDIWFNKTSYTKDQPNGAEMMIWLNSRGVQPSGRKIATVKIAGATWSVWYDKMDWNYIAYVRTSPTNSFKADLKEFFNDAVSRGYVKKDWYLTAVEAGFELWKGGAGLASKSFSFNLSNAKKNVAAPKKTTTKASTTTKTTAKTSTTTTSNTNNCTVSYNVKDSWGSGGVVDITIKNNSKTAVNGWTLKWTFPGNQKITNLWNGSLSQSGASVTIKNASHNVKIPPNGSVSFGFSYNGSSGKPKSFTLNGKTCQIK